MIQDSRRNSASRNFAADYLAPILAWWSSPAHLLSSAIEAAGSDPAPPHVPAERVSQHGWGQREMGADLSTQLWCFPGQRHLLAVEPYLPTGQPVPPEDLNLIILDAYLALSIQGVSHAGH